MLLVYQRNTEGIFLSVTSHLVLYTKTEFEIRHSYLCQLQIFSEATLTERDAGSKK